MILFKTDGDTVELAASEAAAVLAHLGFNDECDTATIDAPTLCVRSSRALGLLGANEAHDNVRGLLSRIDAMARQAVTRHANVTWQVV